MRVTKLSARDFKGQSFDMELAPITLVRGSNGAGKTSRLEALSLAALGYIPADPKPVKAPRDIFDLYSSGHTMAVGFDTDGDLNATRVWSERGGKVGYSGPDGPVLAAALFDLASVYLTASGPERLKVMCKAVAHLKPFDLDKELDALVSAVKGIALPDGRHSPKAEGDLKYAVSAFKDLAARLGAGGLTSSSWLEAVVQLAGSERSAADAVAKRMKATLLGLSQSSEVKVVRQDACEVAAAAKVAFDSASADHAAKEATLAEVRSSYKALRAKLPQAVPDPEALRRTVSTVEEQLKHHEEDKPTGPSEELSAKLSASATTLGAATEAEARARAEKAEAEAALAAAKANKQCPECGHKLTAGQAAGAKRNALEKLEGASKGLDSKSGERESAGLAFDALQREAKAASKRLDEYQAFTKALAESKEALRLHSECQAVEERGKALALEAASLKAAKDKAAVALQVAEADARALESSKGAKSRRAKVAEEADDAESTVKVWRAVYDEVAKRQTEAVEGALDPLLARANSLCGAILPGPLSYSGGEVKVGRWTHRTASDSEKLAAYAALSVAVAADAAVRIAVVGRFESFDPDGKSRLLSAVDSMICKGELDQCLLVEVAGEEEDPTGATRFGNMKVVNLHKE